MEVSQPANPTREGSRVMSPREISRRNHFGKSSFAKFCVSTASLSVPLISANARTSRSVHLLRLPQTKISDQYKIIRGMMESGSLPISPDCLDRIRALRMWFLSAIVSRQRDQHTADLLISQSWIRVRSLHSCGGDFVVATVSTPTSIKTAPIEWVFFFLCTRLIFADLRKDHVSFQFKTGGTKVRKKDKRGEETGSVSLLPRPGLRSLILDGAIRAFSSGK